LALKAAVDLVDLGYDIYIIGLGEQRVNFVKDDAEWGKVSCPPPEHIYDISGLLHGMAELVAFTSLMDGIICPDTSLLHIAGCLKKPTVALFGSTSSKARTSYYPTVVSLEKDIPCRPCLEVASAPKCGHLWCKAMMELEPQEIVQAILEVMNSATR